MGSLSFPPTNIHRRSCTLRRSLRARVSVAAEEEFRHLCRLSPSGQKTKVHPLPAIPPPTFHFATAGIYFEPQAIMAHGQDNGRPFTISDELQVLRRIRLPV